MPGCEGAKLILAVSSRELRTPAGNFPCIWGRGGIRKDKREGDGATPAGVWRLLRVLYRPDRESPPRTGLPVAAFTPACGWCDDPDDPAYNQPVTLPYPGRHEDLWREDGVYDLIVVLDHNSSPVLPGHGSAVFLHIATPDRTPTAGCLALSAPDLRSVLAVCGPGSSVEIPSLI